MLVSLPSGRQFEQPPTLLSQLLCQPLAQPDRLGAETEIGAPDPAVSPQALGHPLGGLQRNRAADTAAEVPAIDADDAAVGVDKWAAGKPRQQLGGHLDEAFDLPAPPASEGAREPADDPNGCLQLTSLADREHDVADTDIR